MNEKQLKREWKSLEKAEGKFLSHNGDKKQKKWQEKMDQIIPKTLQETINMAFFKAFEMILKKGTVIIEKTYNREQKEQDYKINEFTARMKKNRKAIKAFDKQANASKHKNAMISSVGGIGMGLLGMGLPDIPIFLSILLRSIYEIAVSYGFSYDTEEEQIFILKMIETALLHGENLGKQNEEINRWIDGMTAIESMKTIQIKKTSDALAKELLYLKFVQGIPMVGIVGGVSDMIYHKKITDYVAIKYKRRFLKREMNKYHIPFDNSVLKK